ncbi:ABC transporter permease [uncultured Tessaracoccus sp.]|uniref:ABC transporter permease n=1 Tax=uncultured Tessaracoccus sp. TaxID=905023 RepID=UPI0025FFFC7E|nr:ABC transporter permease [uncultured Tessaracoccus sp.]
MRLLTRLAWFAGSLLLASLLIFAATNLLPGDIANVLLGTNASPEAVAQLRGELGLDRPFLLRYLEWLGGVVTGDFGTSMITGRSVTATIAPRIEVSAWLVLFATVGSLLLALPVGTYAALRRRHADGVAVSAASQVGLAVPAFWAGIWLVVLFAVTLRWLPAGGYVSYWDSFGEWVRHLVLPVTALSIVQASVLSRYVRSAVIDVLHTDYFRTARAVGWGKVGALWRHGLRNISISLLTVVGLQIATLLVGAIIIEQVFAIPGLGSRLLLAVTQRDLVVVQGIVLVLVWAVLLINFLVDVAYQFIDPRLKREAR